MEFTPPEPTKGCSEHYKLPGGVYAFFVTMKHILVHKMRELLETRVMPKSAPAIRRLAIIFGGPYRSPGRCLVMGYDASLSYCCHGRIIAPHSGVTGHAYYGL